MDCMGSPTTKQVRPVAIRPGSDQAGEQLVLTAAGVLEFIDQQVADAVGYGQRGIGGKAVFSFKHASRDLRDLGVSPRFRIRRRPLAARPAAWRSR